MSQGNQGYRGSDWSDIASAAIPVAGGLFSGYGAQKAAENANKWNKEMAQWNMTFQDQQRQEANKFSALEAEKNRSFQRSMFDKSIELANTAEQRKMADLKAAGINPMVAYMKQGAGAPAPTSGAQATSAAPGKGAMPTMQGYSKAQIAAQASSTALHLKRLIKETDNLKAMRDKQVSETFGQNIKNEITQEHLKTEKEAQKLRRKHIKRASQKDIFELDSWLKRSPLGRSPKY